MDLKHLTDSQFLRDAYALVQNEREHTTTILHHLCEIDKRKLFADLKCSSLYDHCVRILGYSEASAQRRITSARLMKDLPEIEEKIEYGLLSLSNIAQASTFFNQEDITRPDDKKAVLSQLEGLTRREGEKKLFEMSGQEIPAREERKRISKDKHKVTVILSDKTMEKLDRVEGLIHREVSQEKLLSLMADITIERMMKKKFNIDVYAL